MLSFRKAATIGLAAAGLVLVGLAPSWPQAATPSTTGSSAEGAPSQPGDPFGEDGVMTPKPIVYLKGTATWDSAYDSIVDAFKSVRGFIDREKLKADGRPITIYLATDDTGFQFQAAIPIAEHPQDADRKQ